MLVRLLLAFSALAFTSSCSPIPSEHLSAPQGNWISLFNGKDLNDWTVKIAGHDLGENYANTFRVEDGLLKVDYSNYADFGRQFGSLFHNKKLSRYWIRAEYRFTGKQAAGAPSWAYKDSGIQLHSQPPQSMDKDQEFPVSVEFNLVGGRLLGNRPTGDVCRNGTTVQINQEPLRDKCSASSGVTVKKDDWVVVEAEVLGSQRIRHAVNGIVTADYSNIELDETDADARKLASALGGISLAEGYVSVQSNSHPIEFRRIEVLPLDDER